MSEHELSAENAWDREERFRLLVESSPDIVFGIRADDHTIALLNPAFEELTGWPASEWLGRPFTDLLYPDDIAAALERLDQALRGAVPPRIELRLRRASGDHLDGEALGWPYVIDGRTVGLVGYVRDLSDKRGMQKVLQENEQSFAALIENSLDIVTILHLDGTVRYQSPSIGAILGYAQEELIGRNIFEIIHQEDAPRAIAVFGEAIQEPGAVRSVEYRMLHKDGSWRTLESRGLLLPPHADVSGVLVNTRDLTERKRAEALRDAERHVLELIARNAPLSEALDALAKSLEEASGDGMLSSICLVSEDERTLVPAAAPSLPPAFSQGLAQGVPIGPDAGSCGTAAYRKGLVVVSDIASDPLWVDYRELALQHGLRACWSMPVLSAGGTVLGTFALYYREPRAPDDANLALVQRAANLAGIAIERKRSEELIEHLAFHDVLTGLPNRRLLEDRLAAALALARRTEDRSALMFLDLDRFKNVNDRLGHGGGDRLLQCVAERLCAVIRTGETVARVGGDEFMVLLPRVADPAHAARAAERILAAVRQPSYAIDDQELAVTASIGVALSSSDEDDGETLMRNADAALYRAKELGRDNCQFHEPRKAA